MRDRGEWRRLMETAVTFEMCYTVLCVLFDLFRLHGVSLIGLVLVICQLTQVLLQLVILQLQVFVATLHHRTDTFYQDRDIKVMTFATKYFSTAM